MKRKAVRDISTISSVFVFQVRRVCGEKCVWLVHCLATSLSNVVRRVGWFGGVPVVCREGMLDAVQWCWRVSVCCGVLLPISHERECLKVWLCCVVFRGGVVFLVYFLNINLVF